MKIMLIGAHSPDDSPRFRLYVRTRMSGIFYRPLRLIVEFVAAVIGVGIVLIALLAWRLNEGPITSTYFTPYIEKAINSILPGTRAAIGSTVLVWDNTDHSISLRADDVHITGPQESPVAVVKDLNLRMSIFGLLVGRIVPARMHIDHPQIWLKRDKNGNVLFGGLPAAAAAPNHGDATSLGAIAEDLIEAHFMRRLQITDGAVAVHDEATGTDWSLDMPDAVLERRIGGSLDGQAHMKVSQDTHNALLAVHYSYELAQKQHHLTARFTGINPATLVPPGSKGKIVDIPLTGEVTVAADRNLSIVGGTLDVQGDGGKLDYAQFWDTPRDVKSLAVKARYDREMGKLDVTSTNIDFGGPKLAVAFEGAPPASKPSPHDMDFTLKLRFTDVPMGEFDRLWPKPVIPGAREWIIASLSKGTFDEGDASFKGGLKWNDLDNIEIQEGGGTVAASNATVKYLDGMPWVVGVSAKGSFDLNKMTVTVSGGGIGDLKLQPSTITLSDFEQKVQNIDLPIHITGPMPAVLKLIDAPRFGYAKAVGLSTDTVTGNFDGTVRLKFPLLKDLLMKDADIKATATLTDLASSQLLKGVDIAQGNLALDLDKNGFSLTGTETANKIPVTISWQQAFDENSGKPLKQATVSGNVTGAQWAALGVDVLSKIDAPIAANLQMIQKTKASTTFSGTFDAKAPNLRIDELNWQKAAGAPTQFSFTAEQQDGKDIQIKSIEASGPGLKIKGKGTLDATTYAPLNVTLDPFVAGRSEAALHFEQQKGEKSRIVFSVQGQSFDVTGLRGGNDPDRADPREKEYNLKLGKLYTSAFGFIVDAHGSAVRDPEGWSTISLHGLADGGHQLDIDLALESDGHRTFSLRCDDFGKALKGLGFTDTVKDGKLKVTGVSTPEQPRMIEGKVYIGHFLVKDLPALVVLINATSPFGIIDLFTGSLDFDNLSGKFRWQKDDLDLSDVRASGNTVGITVNGKVDMNNGDADLNGTVAPFSVVNRILNYIPIIGDMITGGEGQGVVGVNYTIKGPLDNPKVGVNPASLLAPGFLRNLFFGSGDDSSSKEPEKENVAPAETPAPVSNPVKTNINK